MASPVEQSKYPTATVEVDDEEHCDRLMKLEVEARNFMKHIDTEHQKRCERLLELQNEVRLLMNQHIVEAQKSVDLENELAEARNRINNLEAECKQKDIIIDGYQNQIRANQIIGGQAFSDDDSISHDLSISGQTDED